MKNKKFLLSYFSDIQVYIYYLNSCVTFNVQVVVKRTLCPKLKNKKFCLYVNTEKSKSTYFVN